MALSHKTRVDPIKMAATNMFELTSEDEETLSPFFPRKLEEIVNGFLR